MSRRRNTTVYNVFDGEGSYYYATLADARAAMSEMEGDVRLDRIQIVSLPPRQLAALLLNGEGFVVAREQLTRGDWDS